MTLSEAILGITLVTLKPDPYLLSDLTLHREDKSSVLDLFCLETSSGVTECPEVQITWPGF